MTDNVKQPTDKLNIQQTDVKVGSKYSSEPDIRRISNGNPKKGYVNPMTTNPKDPQAELREAVYSGRIEKPQTCNRCGGGGRIQGHHEDYTKPFDVVWFCILCHKFVHGRIRDPRLLV